MTVCLFCSLEVAHKEQQTIADDKLSLEKRLQDEIKLARVTVLFSS